MSRSRGRRGWLGLAVAIALIAPLACAGASYTPRARRLLPDARDDAKGRGGSRAVADGGPALAAAIERVALATPRSVPLEVTVLPVATERWALLLHSDGEAGAAYLRVAWPNGRLGPVRTLVGRQVIGGFDVGRPLLLSSDGNQLCVELLDEPAASPRCRPLRAQLAATLNGALALLRELPIETTDANPPKATGAAAGVAPSAHRARPHPRPRRKGKPGAKRATERRHTAPQAGHGSARRAHKRLAHQRSPAPRPLAQRVAIWLHRFEVADGFTAEPIDTGLRITRPMPAMGLIDALGTGRHLRLLWYDHQQGQRRRRARIARAVLRTGVIDEAAHLLKGSTRTVLTAERRYGYLAGHLDPRLFGGDGRIGWLAWHLDEQRHHSEPEGALLEPRAALAPPRALFAIDPTALAAPHARSSVGTPPSRAQAILARHPQRANWQLARARGRVAWAGQQGWCLIAGVLHTVDRQTGQLAALPPPFVGQRARLHWGFIEPDGHGLGFGSDGLEEITANGSVIARGAPDRPRASARAFGRVVRIGASWWMLRPAAGAGPSAELRRLLPSALAAAGPGARIDAGAAALVGGEQSGLLLRLQGGLLAVWRLGQDGAEQLLGRYRTPVRAGFAAVRRAGGGALLAGLGRDGGSVVAAIDGRGTLLAVHPSRLRLRPGRVQLAALPAGGGWLSDAAGERVAWYDDEARELAVARWPNDHAQAACIDGRAARPVQPAQQPGRFVHIAALGQAGSCLWGTATWLAGGGFRWIGSRLAGLDAVAEMVSVPAATFGKGKAEPRATASAPAPHSKTATPSAPGSPTGPAARTLAAAAPTSGAAPPAVAPCPADMVLVDRSLCVDRYEAVLVDAPTGERLSPDYPATPSLLASVLKVWTLGRFSSGDLHAQAMPLPPLWRAAGAAPTPLARSLPGVRPNGFVSGLVARQACERAGKQLCTGEQWEKACRGEHDTRYPYGAHFERPACNVYRYQHPARILHGNAALGHLDPRLNRVSAGGEPLLRATGGSPRCASRWGDDAIYDMVGNLDEWVDDKGGAFAGGFYARATKAGCSARISVHPWRYLDYSLGVRCCLGARR